MLIARASYVHFKSFQRIFHELSSIHKSHENFPFKNPLYGTYVIVPIRMAFANLVTIIVHVLMNTYVLLILLYVQGMIHLSYPFFNVLDSNNKIVTNNKILTKRAFHT